MKELRSLFIEKGEIGKEECDQDKFMEESENNEKMDEVEELEVSDNDIFQSITVGESSINVFQFVQILI